MRINLQQLSSVYLNLIALLFQAHPSVRIRGTEHTYNPVLCQDDNCSGKDKGTHMHCPLCTVVEAYHDPLILRAHYRIKHVDKGIDFAGERLFNTYT